jgi:cytochrome c2
MSKGNFEQEIRALLTDHEVQPPTSSWHGILRKLNRSRYYLGGGALLLAAFISIGFWLQPKENIPTITENALPERLILMIDSSYCEDGSLRLDTIYQELPRLDIDTLPKPRLRAPTEVDQSWVLADPGHPQYVDQETYLRGQQLFRNYCTACHVAEKDMDLTGPSLVGVTARREQQWLYDFTRNSYDMIGSGDPQAVALWKVWRPTIMNNFEQLEDEELHDIYYYIANWELGGG